MCDIHPSDSDSEDIATPIAMRPNSNNPVQMDMCPIKSWDESSCCPGRRCRIPDTFHERDFAIVGDVDNGLDLQSYLVAKYQSYGKQKFCEKMMACRSCGHFVIRGDHVIMSNNILRRLLNLDLTSELAIVLLNDWLTVLTIDDLEHLEHVLAQNKVPLDYKTWLPKLKNRHLLKIFVEAGLDIKTDGDQVLEFFCRTVHNYRCFTTFLELADIHDLEHSSAAFESFLKNCRGCHYGRCGSRQDVKINNRAIINHFLQAGTHLTEGVVMAIIKCHDIDLVAKIIDAGVTPVEILRSSFRCKSDYYCYDAAPEDQDEWSAYQKFQTVWAPLVFYLITQGLQTTQILHEMHEITNSGTADLSLTRYDIS